MRSRSWFGFFSKAALLGNALAMPGRSNSTQLDDPEHDLALGLKLLALGFTALSIYCCIHFFCRDTPQNPLEEIKREEEDKLNATLIMLQKADSSDDEEENVPSDDYCRLEEGISLSII